MWAQMWDELQLGPKTPSFLRSLYVSSGGETGIRTLEGLAPLTVFETAPFDRSGISPRPGPDLVRGAGGRNPSRSPLHRAARKPAIHPRSTRHGRPSGADNRGSGPASAWHDPGTRLSPEPRTPPAGPREGTPPMIRPAATALALLLAPLGAAAQTAAPAAGADAVPADIRAIHEGLLLPEIIEVSAREGAEHGALLAEGIFSGTPVPEEWTEVVEAIYDPAHMEAEILASLSESLEGEDTAAMLAFLESEPGRGLFARELAAREALADEEAEQAAREAAAVAMAEGSPLLETLRRYVEVNDFVESNVTNVMNNNFAYMTGLMDGGAIPREMTEADVLDDIWAQEGRIRADTVEWLFAFLVEAYGETPEADLEALIAFSESEPGRALNRAVFDAFGARYSEISRAMGIAAARYLTTESL